MRQIFDTFQKKGCTVLPPNSRFLGPGIFREFEIHEFKIHYFPPKYNHELVGFFNSPKAFGEF